MAYDSCPKTSANYVPLDHLLRQSDIVTLHTPLNAATHHLLDRRRMEQMKHGALIVNTGRGALLDTDALISALERGRLGGAGVGRPGRRRRNLLYGLSRRSIDNQVLLRLQQLPNVVISPHTAYYTDHALSDTVENSIINCLVFEKENTAWTG